jgi:hypothetical protein
MAEKTKANIGIMISVILFMFTVFGGGVGYGQLKTKADATDQSIKVHCANQEHEKEIKDQNDKEMLRAVVALSENVKQLQKTTEQLAAKVDRLRTE